MLIEVHGIGRELAGDIRLSPLEPIQAVFIRLVLSSIRDV
jgi:hypothetical protein